MPLLRNYNTLSPRRDLTGSISILAFVAAALIASWVLLNSTFLLLALLFIVVLLFLFLKDNLSYFYLVLYGLMICIPWGRTGQTQGQLGWGAPSGAIFNVRVEYTYILILLFLFSVAAREIFKERKRLTEIPNFLYFAIFIAIGVISALLGLNPEEGVLYVLKTVAVPMVGGFLLAFWITNSERSFKTLTWGIMLLTSIISIYAVYEFIANRNPMEMFVLEHLPVPPMETIDTYRQIKTLTYQANATLGNPILAGFVLMAGFILSAGYYVYYSLILRSKKSIIAAVLLVINFSGIGVTFSRGILFSAAIALFLFVLRYLKNIGRSILLIFSVVLVSIFLIQLGLVYYPRHEILIRFDPEHIMSSMSLAQRLNAYIATFDILRAYPLFGTGFVAVVPSIFTPISSFLTTMDNTYLELLSFSGIIGFISFVLLLLKFGMGIRTSLKRLMNLKVYPVLYAMYIGVWGMLIASLGYWSMGQLTSSLTFWTFVGILASITLTDVKYRFTRIE